jgi:hypothetical protein
MRCDDFMSSSQVDVSFAQPLETDTQHVKYLKVILIGYSVWCPKGKMAAGRFPAGGPPLKRL